MMLKKIIIIISGLIGLTTGTLLANVLIDNQIFTQNIDTTILRVITVTATTLLFLLMSLFYSVKLIAVIKSLEEKISKIPLSKVIMTTIGLIMGLLVATLLTLGTDSIVSISWVASAISALFYVVFGYLGFIIGYRRSGETMSVFTKFTASKPKTEKKMTSKITDKVIDTSSLIDSRIHDIAKTGFLEGKIIVPEFVLKELQLISDSEDPLKRAKGRLGLDCVEDLQKNASIHLVIDNQFKFRENVPVDDLIIEYAKKNACTIITTDYNLNKVASLQNIKVLNVNDLSNAVKPIVTAGEKIKVHIQREGKENNQGVAYTEDGTMIVVENGKKYVGSDVEVEVQSVLQTSSGRIIFTKII